MTGPLDALFDPRSVAVVGASDDPASWGHWLARGAMTGSGRRPVHLVNARAAAAGSSVLGRPVIGSVGQLDEVDLVAVAVPGPHVDRVVTEGLDRGARTFVVVTADVSGTGDPVARGQANEALAQRVRAAGARLLGPGSLGVVDTTSSLRLAWGEFAAGPVALVSQSGQVGLEVSGLLARGGLGVSRFVSVGGPGIGVIDVLESLVGHAGTQAVAAYVEAPGDGRALADVAARLYDAGTPLVLLAPGTSESGARAAASHTAALATTDAVMDAVCRAGGAVRLRTPAGLVAAVAGLASGRRAAGRRIAVVSDSGGQGVLAADALSANGLAVPEVSGSTRAALAEALPSPVAVTTNPVDLAGSGEADLESYARAVEVLAGCGEVDAVLLSGYLGRYALDSPDLRAAEGLVAQRLGAGGGVPVVVHSMATDGPTVTALRAAAVPVLDRVEDAVTALAALAAPHPDPPGPLPSRRVASSGASTGPPGPPNSPLGAGMGASGYSVARDLLAGLGMEFPRAVVLHPAAAQPDRAAAAAASLGTRVAVKATSLPHKTEHGGVVLDLVTPDEVHAAVSDLRTRLGEVEITVEAMARPEAGVELLVGARRDPVAGPVVTVAAGGITAQADPDVAVALAPVDVRQASDLLGRLRLAPVLDGWRGRPALDRDAVARCIVAVAATVVDRPSLDEIEVNPLLVTADGAVALDAWAVWREEEQ